MYSIANYNTNSNVDFACHAAMKRIVSLSLHSEIIK